jgi:7-cyano-7-deazaguanine synthase in queuosine biosynthesis
MNIEILIKEPQKGKFAEIYLKYQSLEKEEIIVPLNISFKGLYMFTRQKNGLVLDLFLVSCLVYGIDILVLRSKYSPNGWSRDFDVTIPVECPDVFNKYQSELNHLLSFLTGDNWNISFKQRDKYVLYIPSPRMKYYSKSFRESFRKISLFSGGLDSLIGAIDELSDSKDRIVLASHYDGVFKGPKSDQNKIVAFFNKFYKNNFHVIQTRVDLSNIDVSDKKIEHETTLRSRSFLFLCHAVFVSDSINKNIPIFIPENGTIALNYPLTPSRRSSLSTRTAHPYYLNKLTEYLYKLGITHEIINKYEMKTKGEMVAECNDKNILLQIYRKSCSCAKRGTRKDVWDNQSGTSHCGICMPCVYRRVALNKVNLDNEPVGTDLFHPQKRSLEELPDIKAFIDYISTNLSIEDIEKQLLTNGSLPLDKLNDYAKVIYRTRQEIITWIKQKGNDEIKKMAGLDL